MAWLMAKYKDRPMDVADASLIVAAERLGAKQIFRHINEVAAARAHLLTAARTGCAIERDAGVCPSVWSGRHQGTRIAVRDRPASNQCPGASD